MATQESLIGQPVLTGLGRRGYSWWRDPLRRVLREKPLGTVGAALVLVLAFTGIFADMLMPFTYAQLAGTPYQAPNPAFPMGTDSYGRDVLSRIIYGARISMLIGVGAVSISVTAGTILGVLSAWFGGRADLLFQRLVDATMAIPALVLLLTVVSVLGAGVTNVIIALALRGSITESRIVRSAVLSVKENQYIESARAIGATPVRLMTLHILPNVFAPIIVMATVALGQVILAEASLSFLGFGVPPPTPSWGQMLSSEGRQAMMSAPWLAVFPGVALSAAVFGINMLGDALRDVLDPRLRGGR